MDDSTKVKVQEIKKTVFISTTSHSNLVTLQNIFLDFEVQSSIDLKLGQSIVSSTLNAIENADIICLTVPKKLTNLNSFELGYATAKNKPIIIIGELEPDFDIDHAFFIQADFKNLKAISFQISCFLIAVEDTEYRLHKSSFEASKKFKFSKNLTKTINTFSERSPNLESQLENNLLEILVASNEFSSITPEPTDLASKVYIPDFAVWPEQNRNLFAGPLYIELKGYNPSKAGKKKLVGKLSDLITKSNAGAGLLIYGNESEQDIIIEALFPFIASIPLSEFRRLTSDNSLMSALSQARNSFAHSA